MRRMETKTMSREVRMKKTQWLRGCAARIWNGWTMDKPANSTKRCSNCGAIVETPMSWSEVIVNGAAVIVLLSLLVLAAYIGERWIGSTEHHLVGHLLWREPLDSWNQ